jgi:hypothetical protein
MTETHIARKQHPKFVDLIGRQFGKLTVVGLAPSIATPSKGARWVCSCECGGEKVVIGYSLTNGAVTSCGCKSVLIDITGKCFGKLVVIGRAPSDNYKHTRWYVRCECGVEKDVNGLYLRNGQIRSCGCDKGRLGALKNTIHGRRNTRPKFLLAYYFKTLKSCA